MCGDVHPPPGAPSIAKETADPRILEIVRQFWGFDTLRPLQREAIEAVLRGQDSLVVLPTGGGKSLCYQVPPVLTGRMGVVVSPLISLMKDQVDGLRACGYPAAALNSSMPGFERDAVADLVRAGEVRLLFVAPEKLMQPRFLAWLSGLDIGSFAIDEAHCISHWGHDFRPEYRRLAELKRHFPQAGIHAFTATATPRVREDIVKQLGLKQPAVLVGTFDRPNLTYRVIPRTDTDGQVFEVAQRHAGRAMIVYCITRRDSESAALALQARGVRAEAYHAGLKPDHRREVQEKFSSERIDVVTATVAFGMGIDRSDVRCVVHTALPKSVEHYQQETGRAGRDGLPAECVLLYSASDVMRWESLVRRSAEEADEPEDVLAAHLELLRHMRAYACAYDCRHRALSRYFGQAYPRDNCGACDVCLDENETLDESTITAQKILSCVYRVGQRFGVGHVTEVLVGADTARIRRLGHNKVSTYGLLRDCDRDVLRNFVYQLLDQGLVSRTADDRPTLFLNDASWEVLRSHRKVRLMRPKEKRSARATSDEALSGREEELFNSLRELRRELAVERGVPAYVVFSDVTLRELARRRPSRVELLGHIRGIGERKQDEFGQVIVKHLREYCERYGLEMDVQVPAHARRRDPGSRAKTKARAKPNPEADAMFELGYSIDRVADAMGRVPSTIARYLTAYILRTRPERIDTWVSDDVYRNVAEAAEEVGLARLAPIHARLDEQVSYDEIRLVVAHLEVAGSVSDRSAVESGGEHAA